MVKPDPAAKIFELTDIIEEGLPLDELPEIEDRKQLQSESAADELAAEPTSADAAGTVKFADDLFDDLDDFSGFDLKKSLTESDPVLSELKDAGLEETRTEELNERGGGREVDEAGIPVLNEGVEDLFDDDFDDLDEFDRLLDETTMVEGDFDDKLSAAAAGSPEPDVELPEDYLVGDEFAAEDSAAAGQTETQAPAEPESGTPVSPLRVDPVAAAATAHIFTEPHSLDFSQQIEDMTQEWSKQLLQTTYISMDKMIKAIGDLAPTIVNQVAREVIPPLAEKVIKAEIARLEEKLKVEEGGEQ